MVFKMGVGNGKEERRKNDRREKGSDNISKLKEKLLKLTEFDGKVEILSVRRGRVVIDTKDVAKFSFEEMEEEAEKIGAKWKKEIITDFINYLKSKKNVFKLRPRYVNIPFEVDKEYARKIYHFLQRHKLSFRSFIIKELSKIFGVKYEPTFSLRWKPDENMKFNQVLLPEELFLSIKAKLEKEYRRPLDKRDVRKVISNTIAEIIKNANF